MKQVISQNLTGRYAIIKIFPFIHEGGGKRKIHRRTEE